ncbi:MAG: hypothetical protein WCR56_01595 [Bacilli bacterium]
MGDGHFRDDGIHYDGYALYNLGFTNQTTTASDSGYKKYPQFDHFNLNNFLSSYTYSTDSHNVYLYPIYSSGKDYTNTTTMSYPDIKMSKRVDDSGNYRYKHYLAASDATISGLASRNLKYYYTLSNLYVSSETGSLGSQDRYYTSGYDHQITIDGDRRKYNRNGSYTSSYWSGNWAVKQSIDVSDYDTGCYNLYLYFNESYRQSNLDTANAVVKKNFNDNYEIYVSWSLDPSVVSDLTADGSYYNVYASVLYFIEKVPDFRFVGESISSLSYSKNNGTIIPFQENTDLDGDSSYIYYTNEVILPSEKYTDFVINFGEAMKSGSTVVQIDSNATGTTYPCYEPGSTSDKKTQYKDPSGADVYYLSDKLSTTSSSDLDNPENIQTFKVSAPGVYRFRIKVTYSNGSPSSILLSAAYLRGVFVELFSSNPTDMITNATGTSTGYVDHSAYNYRLNDYYEATISNNPDRSDYATFYKNGDTSTVYHLEDVVPSDSFLMDHVLGNVIMIDSHCQLGTHDSINCFYVNGVWSDSFTLNKNYIFYSHTGVLE